MQKLILTFAILFTTMTASAKNWPFQPDFAFPKKVSETALEDYRKAISDNDGDRIINSLVAYELATVAVDRDSVMTPIALIERAANNADTPTAALLHTLLANIYYSIYSANRYNYDRRELPSADTITDFRLWDGDRFRAKITALLDSALTSPLQLQAVTIDKYPESILIEGKSGEFYPTVYDFVANKVIRLLTDLQSSQPEFTTRLLCRMDAYTKMSFIYESPSTRKILEIYRDLLKFHENDTAPLIMTDINRINFVSRNIFNDGTLNPETQRTELLYELHNRYRQSPYSGEALIEIAAPDIEDETAVNRYYTTVNDYLKAHSDYFRAGCLKEEINRLTQPGLRLTFNRTVTPGDTLEIKVTAFNTDAYRLLIYKVPYSEYSSRIPSGSIPVDTINGTLSGAAPFKAERTKRITITTPGTYAVVPLIKGEPDFSKTYDVFRCTSLMTFTGTCGGTSWGYVINPLTGAPTTDGVSLKITGDKNKPAQTIAANSDDMTPLPPTGNTMYAIKGADRSGDVRIMRSTTIDDRTRYNIQAITDLAVYHPGDTVKWSAILQGYSLRGGTSAVAGVEIEATLRDANYTLIDTITAVTDEFGRVEGQFPLPAQGLTGYYSIQFRQQGENNRMMTSGSKNFMVSDYKLPTYKIEITDISKNLPSNGGVTVTGEVITYSGFPLARCRVTVNLDAVKYSWWRRSMQRSFYSTEIVTNDDGRFKIEFSPELLQSSPIQGGTFEVKLTATSPTGENQSASRTFTTGKPYMLNVAVKSNIDISRPVTFPVTVTDLMSQSVSEPVRYSIIAGTDTIHSGVIDHPDSPVDLSTVPSGTYSIRFCTANPMLSEPYTATPVNLYRPDDKLPPATEDPLWIPVDNYIIPDHKISVLYGTREAECNIHYAVSTPDSLLAQGWINVKPGIHRFEYTLPEGIGKATVTLSAAASYRFSRTQVAITCDSSIKELQLSIESFRDRITPGSTETWHFRVTDRSGNGVYSAMMLDMYSKALDRLLPYTMKLSRCSASGSSFRANTPAGIGETRSYLSLPFNNALKCPVVTLPEIRTWGQPYYSEILYAMATSLRMARATADGTTVDTPMMAKNEMADTETADTDETFSDGGTPSIPEDDNFEYRPSEMPLAFFHPMLTTNIDGSLEFSFTAPNANTTWQLCALAFDKEMVPTTITREIISSKPIMVQPNMPGFLRSGDEAVINALIMNNSSTELKVNTVVELFDPATNKLIDSMEFINHVPAGETATVNTSVNASDNTTMLGYRIKSSTDDFTDGEQSIIPVISSIAPVMETLPFYIPSSENDFSLQLPEIKADAAVTLQFCNNPVWYVVTALPGLLTDNSTDALSSGAAIFSAAVAEGIIHTNPGIADALRQWTSANGDRDSLLVAMLERNSDLKTIMLNSTPWVTDAMSQTERMERLSLLFDKKMIENVYTSAIKNLTETECADGGWTWTPQYKQPSTWITTNLLTLFGQLRQLGFAPENATLDNMIDRAVAYLDREAADMVARNQNATDMSYLIVRDYYPETAIAPGASRLVDNTLAGIRDNWKTYNLPMKAIAAIIINSHGDKPLAGTIVESLREYSTTSPEKGMWWPSLDNMTVWPQGKVAATSIILDAFVAVNPQSPDIDLIRQWLILQKEANDWGLAISTTEAIHSILTTGSQWVRSVPMPEILIGDKRIPVGNIDERLGYMRTDITSFNPSNSTLFVNGREQIPSWGAVYTMYRSKITDIKASGCDDVTINKQLFKRVTTGSGVTWMEADTLQPGDIVQVNLTIEVKRDMDYVVITDNRGACFEPVEQLPMPIYSEGICFYRENRDTATNMFVDRLPKGTYRLSYELYVNNSGRYSSGVATIQSQYAPAMTAHSSGTMLNIARRR